VHRLDSVQASLTEPSLTALTPVTRLVAGTAACYGRFDYVDRLIFVTSAPLVLIFLIVVAFALHVTWRRFSKKEDDAKGIHSIVSLYFSFVLFITYLVLPSATTSIFGMFPCQNVDPEGTHCIHRNTSSRDRYDDDGTNTDSVLAPLWCSTQGSYKTRSRT